MSHQGYAVSRPWYGDCAQDASGGVLRSSDVAAGIVGPAMTTGCAGGASAPSVARWLGDIRGYFPSTVVQIMQADAIERLRLHQLLLEPEMLQAVVPDVHLVGTLLSLNRGRSPGHRVARALRRRRAVLRPRQRRALAAMAVPAFACTLTPSPT